MGKCEGLTYDSSTWGISKLVHAANLTGYQNWVKDAAVFTCIRAVSHSGSCIYSDVN